MYHTHPNTNTILHYKKKAYQPILFIFGFCMVVEVNFIISFGKLHLIREYLYYVSLYKKYSL